MPLPSGYTLFQQSPDQVVATHASHTVQVPRQITYRRVVPKRASNGRYSNARYDVKLTRGIVDSDGNLVGLLTVGTTGISVPVNGVSIPAALAEEVAVFAAVTGHTDFAADVIAQKLPTSA